jgi:voltage-gated potassium channel
MRLNVPKLHPFQILVLILSVYVIIALVIDTFIELDPEVSRLLNYIDNGICVIFLIEFFIRFFRAENKWRFMRWGWIDLLSSIPAVGFLRVGRMIRIIRLLRILRAFRSFRILFRYLFHNRVEGTFTSVGIIAVLMVIFSAIGVLSVEETAPNSNIKTAGDALWWAYVTITTVGYGDHFPVTGEGRVIAAALMTVGVGLFGTFTAYVASWFVKERKDREEAGNGNTQPEDA